MIITFPLFDTDDSRNLRTNIPTSMINPLQFVKHRATANFQYMSNYRLLRGNQIQTLPVESGSWKKLTPNCLFCTLFDINYTLLTSLVFKKVLQLFENQTGQHCKSVSNARGHCFRSGILLKVSSCLDCFSAACRLNFARDFQLVSEL